MTIDLPHMLVTMIVIFVVAFAIEHSGLLHDASRSPRGSYQTALCPLASVLCLPLPATAELHGLRDPAATVGALTLVTEDVDALRGIILSRLLDDYASVHGITVDEKEIDTHLARMDKQLREDLGEDYDDGSSLTPEERAASDRMRRNIAEAVIGGWKVKGNSIATTAGASFTSSSVRSRWVPIASTSKSVKRPATSRS